MTPAKYTIADKGVPQDNDDNDNDDDDDDNDDDDDDDDDDYTCLSAGLGHSLFQCF